jgi:flagellar motility protein MotE (MotC chaperone)
MTPFPFGIRVLPVLCGAASLLLAVKLATIGMAVAEPAVAEPRPQTAAAPDRAKPEPAKEEGAKPAAEAKPAQPGRAAPQASLSPAELDVLGSLAARRAELDRRADEIQQREVLLKATEQRINDKIAQLQTMERSIGDAVKKRDEEDEAKIKNLVRIYETMKPKEAARIFEQLDTPVLLEVTQRMKDAKVAPILASMDPAKAKSLTLALAERKPASASPAAPAAAAAKPAAAAAPAAKPAAAAQK